MGVHAIFLVSSVATGALFALGARMLGIEHDGVLIAVGVIGAGLQMLLLIGWYLYYSRARQPAGAPERP